MNNSISKFLFLATLSLSNCGTGPWYIQNKLYKIYKEPIQKDSHIHFKTNGFYEKLSDSTKINSSKNVLVFNNKGYCTSLKYNDLQKNKIIELDLDWWQVKNDSIIIENYGETKRLIKSQVWWHKGKILNDSIIEIAYQDKNYQHETIKYKFIKSSQIPELKNKARYFKKKWYLLHLNKARK